MISFWAVVVACCAAVAAMLAWLAWAPVVEGLDSKNKDKTRAEDTGGDVATMFTAARGKQAERAAEAWADREFSHEDEDDIATVVEVDATVGALAVTMYERDSTLFDAIATWYDSDRAYDLGGLEEAIAPLMKNRREREEKEAELKAAAEADAKAAQPAARPPASQAELNTAQAATMQRSAA